MKKIQTRDIWLFVAQVLLLSLILLSPGLISYITSNDSAVMWFALDFRFLAGTCCGGLSAQLLSLRASAMVPTPLLAVRIGQCRITHGL